MKFVSLTYSLIMASPKATRINSLQDLYSSLEGENGLDFLKQKLQEWEFDFQCIEDDVQNPEPDLKGNIPPLLFNKILSIINGDCSISSTSNASTSNASTSNQTKLDPQIIKLRDRISSKIVDATAVEKIMEKITTDEV